LKREDLDAIIAKLWLVIDEAESYFKDPKSTPADKKAWATILANAISVLNHGLMLQKGEKLEEEDLTGLFEKVPEKYVRMVMDFFKKAESESKQADKPVGSVYEQVRELKFGDPIHIWWIDASSSQNVDINKLPLPNHNVETRKEGIPGIFVTVQKGDIYHDEYLVYWTDNMDDMSYTIESVPLVVVKKIVKVSKEL